MADMATNEGVLYSPTSSAGSEGGLASPAGDDDEPFGDLATDPLAKATTEPVYKPKKPQVVAPRPVLLVGPRFDKQCPLNANRWVKIGRSKKSQVMLNNNGVSRNHCSMRWDRHRRVVEIKDTSSTGTLINGEAIRAVRRTLAHGDRVRVEGKGSRFDFLLDLRPVSLALTDPREEHKEQRWRKLRGPALAQRRDALRAQRTHLESSAQACEQQAFEKEREFYNLLMRRNVRASEDQQREEDLQKYLAGTRAMEEKINDSREEWHTKIDAEHGRNDLEVKPLIRQVGELQTKVEKLQMKKDELERTIHPEKYAVADVSRVDSYSMELPTPQKTPSLDGGRPLEDADGEEDDLFGGGILTGLGPGGELKPAAGAALRLPESPGFEPADEPEAKRPRQGAGPA